MCPCEEDNQDEEITIFDEGESVKVIVDPDSFSSQYPNMIPSVRYKTSANANHNLCKDTFVLNYITYIIDDEHPIKPCIYPKPQHFKGMQLHVQSLAIIIHKVTKDKVCFTALPNTYFLDDDGVLNQSVREGVHICKAMVVPKMPQQPVLTPMHDPLGQNGTMRLYNYIRQFYFWHELK